MKEAKNYIVLSSPFNSSLYYEYEQVQGCTAIEAARQFVSTKYNTVKRSGSRAVNLCLIEGRFDEYGNVRYRGKRQWYECFNSKTQEVK